MAKMTIAKCREREVYRLAEYHAKDPSREDIEKAWYLMNSFYRLCGLCERNLYLAYDDRTANLKSTKASEEREYKWYKRLSKDFEDFSGLTLTYCGYMPSIGIIYKDTGGFSEKISRYFYN